MDEKKTRAEAIGDQLRSQIASKFQISAFLAGFALTLLGIQLTMLWSGKPIPLTLPLAIGMLVLAAILYVFALYHLDGLTMPKRFWSEDPKKGKGDSARLAYLEDEDLWALQERMLFYWKRLIIPALLANALSVLLVLVPISAEFSLEVMVSGSLLLCIAAAAGAFVYARSKVNVDKQNFHPLCRAAD